MSPDIGEGSRQQLTAGNGRFVDRMAHTVGAAHLADTLSAQAPFAVVLGCADSRVPPEVIFDQPVGRLFVIRVAGNTASAAELGSIEYAVDRFGCPLVLVLGHTLCGAVGLAIRDQSDPWRPSDLVAGSPSVGTLIDEVRGGLRSFRQSESDGDDAWAAAVRRNVRASIRRISEWSPFMAQTLRDGRVAVLGAIYDVRTGRVEFLPES